MREWVRHTSPTPNGYMLNLKIGRGWIHHTTP